MGCSNLELQYIRDHYQLMSAAEIAQALGRKEYWVSYIMVRFGWVPGRDTPVDGLDREWEAIKDLPPTLRKRLRSVWSGMIRRCYNPKSTGYARYGGRGISVCDEWLTSFRLFILWAIVHGYRPGLQLDREDTNGNYCPENCRFITQVQQANNRRNNRLVTAFGEQKTVAEWSRDRRCAVTYRLLYQRLYEKKDPEWSITTPPDPPR